ncbi:NAD(P)-dependent oxidoreductase [Rhodococcus ruber]|uniref:NAD(P)-dependent oxidoreductase n=1 Tax=Rhodococcus ruber TaxID=1830 RepID=UPI0005930BCE|nr:NAD(P)-dependent oxidoreductase [Rhodococcus ruber]
MRVGFIGLGSQGGPMAGRIIEAGFPTTLWARRSASLEQYADTSAQVADSPAALGASSDVVCICVVNDAGVEEVLSGADGVLEGLAPGGIIVIHSTIHPDTCRRMEQAARAKGIALIDAPVSGGGNAAAAGRLLVMAGGDPSVLERCRPVLTSFADPIVHLGPVGAGQVSKLLNNTLLAANFATTASILDVARALGVDSGRLLDVMSHGSGGSFALDVLRGAEGSLVAMADGAGTLLTKDVGLLTRLAEAADAPRGIVWDAARDALARMGLSD